jgi:hypothetical protein
MLEKRFKAIPPQLFINDATANGVVKINNAEFFKVKQQIIIAAPALTPLELEVKSVEDATTLIIGPRNTKINETTNLSLYTVSSGSFIFANEQKRPSIPQEEVSRAVYEEEPAVALRNILVDKLGVPYGQTNPFPVTIDGEVNIENANIDVKLSHLERPGNVPADSVRLGDGIETFTGSSTNIQKYLLDTMSANRLIRKEFDDIEVLNKNDDGDPTVIAFRSNGSLVATLNLTYDSDSDFARAQVVYV